MSSKALFRSAFTLIELLVVLAIIAILAIVVIITLNPTELLRQGRDSNRVADMNSLNQAISLAQLDGLSIGNANTVYLSVPDPALSGSATSTCPNMGLPSLPVGWNYQCSSPQNYRQANGTGWIPASLQSTAEGSIFGALPVDPINSTNTYSYYTYVYGGTNQWQLMAHMESQKYVPLEAASGGTDPAAYTAGSAKSLAPFAAGLAGWWTLNEGSGSVAIDSSGYNSTGTWAGTQAGNGGTYYASGNNQAYAGYFNGSNDMVKLSGQGSANYTITAWVNGYGQLGIGNINGSTGRSIFVDANGTIEVDGWKSYGSGVINVTGLAVSTSSWNFIAIEPGYVQANGSGQSISFGTFFQHPSGSVAISGNYDYGGNSWNFVYGGWTGLVDNVRIYNRTLSTAEIQAIYASNK